RRFDGVGPRSHDQIVGDARQNRGQPGQPLRMTVRIDRFDREVFAFNPSQLPQALAETIDVGVRCDGEPANARTFGLRARRKRPSGCTTKRRYELTASPGPMPPALPTPPPGTPDCCIRPPGRNEMTAIPPPIISSKEVAQKQAPPLPPQNLPSGSNFFIIVQAT